MDRWNFILKSKAATHMAITCSNLTIKTTTQWIEFVYNWE